MTLAVSHGCTADARPPPPVIDAQTHVREVVRRSGTSFGPGMKILTKPKQEAMYAVYAFCREVDDIADDPALSLEEKRAQLTAWQDEIDRLFAGQPTWPTAIALAKPIERYGLPKAEFTAMIDGMLMDARGTMIAPGETELATYTRRVAGAAGMLSIRIFGDHSEAADRFALALGDAFQLTNILRDVAEDAAEGRLYLPRELLQAHEIIVPDDRDGIAAVLADPRLSAVCRDLGARAAGFFDECRCLAPAIAPRVRRPAVIMWRVYERYLRVMERRGWESCLEPPRLSKWAKAKAALSGLLWP